MKILLPFLLFLFGCISLVSAQKKKPKLVVGIVVDQMRPDYLRIYAPTFGEGGFKRIMKEGFEFRNVHYGHIPTYTGPGHASVYTGTYPAIHGIVANDWYSRELGRTEYCAEDTTQKALGGITNGDRSPINLLSSTITDELKIATNFKAKVVGMSIKDRGAILPAGKAGDAYWYDSRTGNFITSTWYRKELTPWVKEFNESKKVDSYLNQKWELLLKEENYLMAGMDDQPYEYIFKGRENAIFPYDFKKLRADNRDFALLPYTPFGNTALVDLAEAAIKAEQMGQDEITDFLAISFSATDYVGHFFGPQSLELQDIYARLDRDLERLLNFLDKEVGKGEYTLFISTDHGAVDTPKFQMDRNLTSGLIDEQAEGKKLQEKLNVKYGDFDWIEYVGNEQIYLNHQLIEEKKVDLKEIQEFVAMEVSKLPGIKNAWPSYLMKTLEYNRPPASLLQNGYHFKRSGDVMVVFEPGYTVQLNIATTHGSGYAYDTHAPMLWFGTGIPQGSSVEKYTVYDIAVTLAMLLDTKIPSGSFGEVMEELFED